MANRPFFIPSINKYLVETQTLEFKWFSGFAKTQKQKSIYLFIKIFIKEFKFNKIIRNINKIRK